MQSRHLVRTPLRCLAGFETIPPLAILLFQQVDAVCSQHATVNDG